MRTKLPWRTVVLSAVLALGLTACGGGTEAADATVPVTTDKGVVNIPAAPRKVVVLNPALTGYLYGLGVPVGATIPTTRDPSPEGFSQFWAEQAKTAGTKVLPWSFDGFDFEAILGEKPDLIVAGGQGRPGLQAVEAYDRLSQIAPTVIVSTKPSTWRDELSFLAGQVFRKPAEAKTMVDAYQAKVTQVKAATKRPDGAAIYLMTTTGGTYFLPEGSALPATMSDLGFPADPVGQRNPNLKPASTGDSVKITPEQLGSVVTAPVVFVVPFQPGVPNAAALAKDPLYAGLPAFRAGKVYDLPGWTYRADYQAVMATLDHVQRQFAGS
ncbi:ABC transporter substrate-binding protein [Amycolatopsis suaedae]|uniref:Ferric enterobactin (Enterochelin)-binding protein n=1 Tax=Amycolatopsis suaedae TaxID=2510978 RepID=A0A4Q7J903_9PSEU|nr:ABC transporter substrate-binding protein [Amycolatopsis suaedae]RZQ63352.1 ferric enterobactin (enterochelin)-binding protein [Amycolatopsis suaedae]